MMRLKLCCLLVFVSVAANAQLMLKNVVTLTDSTTDKQTLYNRAKGFFVDEYQSSKDVITSDSPNTFTLTGRGWLDLKSKNVYHKSAKLWHSIKIECKDGRYRYEISKLEIDIVARGVYGGTQTSKSDYLSMLEKINEMREGTNKEELRRMFVAPVEELIERLNRAMSKKEEEW